jgi:glycosyltransferase involved in cell wall biosynthesis
MRIAIITDAWHPQVNGVVTTMDRITTVLKKRGHDVIVIDSSQFYAIPCPSYPEIKLALNVWNVADKLHSIKPDAIHIVTEGPLGLAARRICRTNGWEYTTSYHTKFPEYIQVRWGVPVRMAYAWVRWFHAESKAVFVATPSLKQDLEHRGFKNLVSWTRGVDTELFHPKKQNKNAALTPPIWLYVGRIAAEKNLEAFLNLALEGTKILVGDGPDKASLQNKYPNAVFTGTLHGEALATAFANADVFVFPSKTDTFGLVLLEALASGTPVAAYPVTGPIDVITSPHVGCLNEDLKKACQSAILLDRKACRLFAEKYSWEACAEQFEHNLFLVKALQHGRGQAA